MAEEKQNGYTRFYNGILDLALSDLSGNDLKLFFYIYRKTIGWKKKSDKISYSQITNDIGLHPVSINRTSNSLESSGWITVNRGIHKKGNEPSEYSIFGKVLTKQYHLTTAILNSLENGTNETVADNKQNSTIPTNETVPQGTNETVVTKERRKENNINSKELATSLGDVSDIFCNQIGPKGWFPRGPKHHALIQELAEKYTLEQIDDGIRDALKANPDLTLPGALQYTKTVIETNTTLKERKREKPPEEYNRDIETERAIDTLKTYKLQLERGLLKKAAALFCIKEAIQYFEDYDINDLAASGTDESYWRQAYDKYNNEVI